MSKETDQQLIRPVKNALELLMFLRDFIRADKDDIRRILDLSDNDEELGNCRLLGQPLGDEEEAYIYKLIHLVEDRDGLRALLSRLEAWEASRAPQPSGDFR